MITFLAVMITVLCVLAAWSRLLREHPTWNAAAEAEPVQQGYGPDVVVPCRSGPGSLHGQLVFAQPMPGSRIGLDCLLTGSDDGEAAWPVHVVAALPANTWLAAVEEALIQDWLARGELVGVSVSGEAAAPRIRVACHRTTMLLDEQAA